MTDSQEDNRENNAEVANQAGVHVLYKNLGETPLACLQCYRLSKPELKDVPMTYAGRLDPMAEGVLIILSGDLVHKKERFLHLEKEYEFEILWGFETDTNDILGIVQHGNNTEENVKETKRENHTVPVVEIVQGNLKKMKGKIVQKYPAYSSRTVKSKPLLEWSRAGKIEEVEIPEHEVEISESKYISRRVLLKEELEKEILRRIDLVVGDFRQEEIKEKWRKLFRESDQAEFVLDTISLRVSSGFYIRQFVSDFAETFLRKATTFHIVRKKVGEYIT